MSFYVKQLGRVIHGRDSGSNKQTASKSCALSLVRQLFHLGVIEAFSGIFRNPYERIATLDFGLHFRYVEERKIGFRNAAIRSENFAPTKIANRRVFE